MEASSQRPLAVVTGASSGIGYELAKQFATNGFDLIVCAEDSAIVGAARGLEGLGASAEAVQADLGQPEGVEQLHGRITAAGRPVAAIALNAGIGMGGAFATDTDLAQELQIVDLNCRSTVHLAKLVLQDMVARDEGRLLFTSSIASTMPGSFQAVYNASKSFVQSFALALREELKDTNVTVTSLMPGPTDTEFFERADMLDTKVGTSDSQDDPEDVARDGFEALMAGKERVVSHSLSTKVQGRAGTARGGGAGGAGSCPTRPRRSCTAGWPSRARRTTRSDPAAPAGLGAAPCPKARSGPSSTACRTWSARAGTTGGCTSRTSTRSRSTAWTSTAAARPSPSRACRSSRRGPGGCRTARCSSSRCVPAACCAGATAASRRSTPTSPRSRRGTSTTWWSTRPAARTSATSASTS